MSVSVAIVMKLKPSTVKLYVEVKTARDVLQDFRLSCYGNVDNQMIQLFVFTIIYC